ncbi:hypothetical protein [Tsukamurella hominis]|uniref:hypothetical protein n=1 Tax=Tsukamurella hominis TaxID=1970232 RepID=UPI0039E807CD
MDRDTEGARSPFTVEQERALRDAGSLVEHLPPVAELASTRTAAKRTELVRGGLAPAEAADRLGVPEEQIVRRVSDRTLYVVDGRLPIFQFTVDGELPGWARVAARIPVGAYPVAVARFMTAPHPDLQLAGVGAVSPVVWLVGGGSPVKVAALVAAAFSLVGM